MKHDLMHTLLGIVAADCERKGLPNATGREFTDAELDSAREEIEDAERMLEEADRDDVPSLQQEREMRDAKLDDPKRGCVPPYFNR